MRGGTDSSALSPTVALKVNCNLKLSLMGSGSYHTLGARIRGAYTTAESRHILQRFIKASARITIWRELVTVRLGARAHNSHPSRR
jgi:hypothetical protein